jgi:hypothetical protein
MVDSFAIDVKRGRRDLKFAINAKGGVCWSVCTGCCTGFVINVKLEAARWFAESSFGIRESKKGGAPTFDIMICEIVKCKVPMGSGPSNHERLWVVDRKQSPDEIRTV